MLSRINFHLNNTYLRRGTFALIIIIGALIQNSAWIDGLFGVKVFLLIPLVTCIAMFERENAGMIFGLFAGALWDTASTAYGYNAIMLTLTGFVCGALITNLMRNSLITALFLSSVFTLLHSFIYWFGVYIISGNINAAKNFFTFYLPSSLLTILLMPIFYFLIRAVAKQFRSR